MTLSDLRAALGIAPKTLPQARETLEPAKATLDSVVALFSAAGLELEPMLAAGPDSLKAHLESLDNSVELAEALTEIARFDEELAETQQKLSAVSDQLSAFNAIASAIDLGTTDGLKSTPDQIAAAFSAHIAKQVTLALAKTGHPPVVHVPADAPLADQATSDAEHLKAYEALSADPTARAEYFAKHEQAIWRGAVARKLKS